MGGPFLSSCTIGSFSRRAQLLSRCLGLWTTLRICLFTTSHPRPELIYYWGPSSAKLKVRCKRVLLSRRMHESLCSRSMKEAVHLMFSNYRAVTFALGSAKSRVRGDTQRRTTAVTTYVWSGISYTSGHTTNPKSSTRTQTSEVRNAHLKYDKILSILLLLSRLYSRRNTQSVHRLSYVLNNHGIRVRFSVRVR
jgi:hypothetical protein